MVQSFLLLTMNKALVFQLLVPCLACPVLVLPVLYILLRYFQRVFELTKYLLAITVPDLFVTILH